jgi:hypothetical protein
MRVGGRGHARAAAAAGAPGVVARGHLALDVAR